MVAGALVACVYDVLWAQGVRMAVVLVAKLAVLMVMTPEASCGAPVLVARLAITGTLNG